MSTECKSKYTIFCCCIQIDKRHNFQQKYVPHFVPYVYKGKGKAVPLQAYSAPEGSKKLTFPDFRTTALGGGKVVSLTHWPPLPLGNTPDTLFC